MSSKYTRLDRLISRHLGINRKHVRLMLAKKRVSVDGEVADNIDALVGPFNVIVVDNHVIQDQQAVYIMLHKPLGFVSATRDDKHPTVLDLIEQPHPVSLHIVGRLDLNSTGLLLLTNDGKWSKALLSPQNKITKCYSVNLKNELTQQYIQAFAEGMYFSFEDVKTQPVILTITGKRQAQVILKEGRYHQIKRMFGRFRNPVESLHRSAIGNIRLPEELKPGEYRQLSAVELNDLNSLIERAERNTDHK